MKKDEKKTDTMRKKILYIIINLENTGCLVLG